MLLIYVEKIIILFISDESREIKNDIPDEDG